MKQFLDHNFLLHSDIAEGLYHDSVKDLPIIDYHNHLPPDDIANNKVYKSITEVWLKGDHYKWRAMRSHGIDEHYITGDATDKEKFLKWAETVPHTLRNPLYHWTHLELQRYFGIKDLLSPANAEDIYLECNKQLTQGSHSALGLLDQMNVQVVCTTDEPTDTLEHHTAHQATGASLKMLPTFRPDKLIQVDSGTFHLELQKLEACTGGTEINTFYGFIAAMESRVDFFASVGCKLADHGLSHLYNASAEAQDLDKVLLAAKSGGSIDTASADTFKRRVLIHLGGLYAKRGWTMQLHLGAIRNNNDRLQRLVGADIGCDSIGDYTQTVTLSSYLNELDAKHSLPKTILYNLNPRDNEAFASMAGNFNDGNTRGKVQWGSAWWFLDQKDGIEKQLNTLSNLGLLSNFIGMLTDSRSFLSFPRHEYFRRILCNLIGKDVMNGELPNDPKMLGDLVSNICYHNSKHYFNF